jgi:alpha-L-fucosidase
MNPSRLVRSVPLLAALAATAASGAPAATEADRESRLRLPESVRKGNASFVEEVPQADYRHASAEAHQAFRAMKYGVRIHWGLYSLLPHARESWTFLELPDDQRQAWLESYKTWNPQKFSADGWMEFFNRSGFKCFAITTKHHEGFSLWDTKTRVTRRPNFSIPNKPFIEDCDVAYSVMETPSRRDIIRELTDAARRHDLRINLYFSHTDWYDVNFRPHGRHPLQTVSSNGIKSLEERQKRPAVLFPDLTPVEIDRMVTRHREQLRELMTQYGPIDMLCLDISLGADSWPQVRETIKEVRRLQPNIMMRNRGIGNYGDYYTPERVVPGDKAGTDMPWMVIYPLGRNFSWEGDASQYKGAKWVVDNLVDSVSKGGNFMVAIGPNGDGEFHPTAIAQLEEVGAWLKVNGEAIWGTHERPGDQWKEGDGVRFTASDDGRHVYAHLLARPGSQVVLTSVQARANAEIRLLGLTTPLTWTTRADGALVIDVPTDAPGSLAWVLKIPVGA